MYEVQNTQLNKGLPQEFDARDIFSSLKLFKFDKTSLRSAYIAGGNSNVPNWFHDVINQWPRALLVLKSQ